MNKICPNCKSAFVESSGNKSRCEDCGWLEYLEDRNEWRPGTAPPQPESEVSHDEEIIDNSTKTIEQVPGDPVPAIDKIILCETCRLECKDEQRSECSEYEKPTKEKPIKEYDLFFFKLRI